MRRYGERGRSVIVLHGGPGAPGSAGELARALGDSSRAIEPWQRRSSDVPLTVDRHLRDISDVIAAEAPGEKPAIVGESWGAMLALAFAAANPEQVSALALVGCGTFDLESRACLQATLEERTARGRTLPDSLYTYQRIGDVPVYEVDEKGHHESWSDMLRLQQAGTYPAAFAAIRCPVLMLHGAYDPHPGEMIRRSLLAHIPQLEYRELERCGHTPWVEQFAREEFLRILNAWLESNNDERE